MNILELRDVSCRYGVGTPFEMTALSHVSVGFEKGKTTGIIGHTGSGKSTLVQMLNGLLKPESGEVLLDGESIWKNPKDLPRVRFRVGLVMQYPEYQLFDETVRADIGYAPRNMGLSPEEIRERVMEAIRFVGLDESLLDKPPLELSGGQKRRAAIAGIIAMRPEILVLDEPAAGLDPRGKAEIFESLNAYKEAHGATVILVSHSMEDMAKYCDDLVVMSEGKILLCGECREVFSHAEILESVGLDVPQATKLLLALKSRGFDVDCGALTVDEALEQIKKLYHN